MSKVLSPKDIENTWGKRLGLLTEKETERPQVCHMITLLPPMTQTKHFPSYQSLLKLQKAISSLLAKVKSYQVKRKP